MKRTSASGFSLIELMIVVVIVAILASIAIPSYNSSIRKSRRTEAKMALTDLASREERLYATQQAYSNSPVVLGYGSGAWPVVIGSYYSIQSVSSSPASSSAPGTYSLTVQPTAGSTQLKDTPCQKFIQDQTGKQTSQDASSIDSTSTCWP